MELICGFLLALCVAAANGEMCKDLTGTWRNELGSNMKIQYLPNDNTRISGCYNSSVEPYPGAFIISSTLAGLVQYVENGSLIGFSVLWNRGETLATWVGQCMICKGVERIYTTWTFRSLQSPIDKWKTTLIKQNNFYRVEDVEGQPSSGEDTIGDDVVTDGIIGKWRPKDKDTVEFMDASSTGSLKGQHTEYGDSIPELLVGRYDGNSTHTAFGFVSSFESVMAGWTGHIYSPSEKPNVLETEWLSHNFSDNCKDPRKFVQYGLNNYTKVQS